MTTTARRLPAADTITAVLAGNLRRHREHAGMSQADLSRKAAVSGAAISLIEGAVPGHHTSLRMTVTLAAALGVPVRALLLPPACGECGDLPRPGYRCLACHQGDRRAS